MMAIGQWPLHDDDDDLLLLLQMIPVAANDVAFSVHAVILTAFLLFQIAIYQVSLFSIIMYLFELAIFI